MPRYNAEQIYAFAREAGFSPDQATTMTAVSLAESGGDSRSHATVGEDSRGLWQINAATHPGLATKYDLWDPKQNALAAYEVSHGGSDVSPWTVTHHGSSARYLHFQHDAQAAAAAYGDGPGLGTWTGTQGYGHPLNAGSAAGGGHTVVTATDTANTGGAGSDDGAALGFTSGPADGPAAGPAAAADGADYGLPFGPPAITTTSAGTGAGTDTTKLDLFVDSARAQAGDQYIYGYEVNLDDPHPKAFDCSELVQWAAHQAHVTVEDGAVYQYRQMNRAGSTIPVEQALHTRGALLFYFNTDPNATNPVHAHVAISLGDGHTIEARNSKLGVGVFDAKSVRFNYAAVIPGLAAPAPATPAPATPVPLAADPPPNDPSTDHSQDDHFDRRLGFDPDQLDTTTPATTATDDTDVHTVAAIDHHDTTTHDTTTHDTTTHDTTTADDHDPDWNDGHPDTATDPDHDGYDDSLTALTHHATTTTDDTEHGHVH